MSRKIKRYTAEFKTKIVLEVLQGDKTLNEIASEYSIIPKNIMNWKKVFLENAVMAMEPSKAIKEYEDENIKLKEQLDEYTKKLDVYYESLKNNDNSHTQNSEIVA